MTERDWYYRTKIKAARRALEKNGMKTYMARTGEEARRRCLSLLRGGSTVGLGGSRTVAEIGLLKALRSGNYKLFDQYDPAHKGGVAMEVRKQGTAAEFFVTGTNAVTEDGKLVNVDGVGNRLAALCFGPERVMVVVGRNKIVPDVAAAIWRVRNVAAPMNARRLGLSTPCARTGRCTDCESPQRICSLTLIVEKQKAKGRIVVVLVNEDLGF